MIASSDMFKRIIRYLRESRLNRTCEYIAWYKAKIEYWETKVDSRTQAIPADVACNLSGWRANLAVCECRRNRLQAVLKQS